MKKIYFVILLLSLIPSTLFASEKYINSTYFTFLNYSELKPQIKDYIDSGNLTFVSNNGEIKCSSKLEKCIIKTDGIYSGNIEIYTKLDGNIIKTDTYIIDKTDLIVSKLNLRTDDIIRTDLEYLYSYGNEDEEFKSYMGQGLAEFKIDRGNISCENEICNLDTRLITYGVVNIDFLINGNVFKKLRFRINKYGFADLLKPLSKYGFGEALNNEETFNKINLRNIDSAKINLNYAKGDIFINSIIKDDLWELGLNYKKNIGTKINISSGYRDFLYQQKLYANYLRRGMQDYSTFAKRSEHHLGTALDFGLGGNENNYAWLNNNAWKYGFIRSYTQECEYKTAIKNEIWHFRWIGKEAASDFHYKNQANSNYCAIDFLRDNFTN